MYAERFDFLMKLTNTKNSDLGQALSFDPSYISKIRMGKRNFPKKETFTEKAAAYFARRITEGYQLKAAGEVILGRSTFPEDPDERTDILALWLGQGNSGEGLPGESIKRFITGFSVSPIKKADTALSDEYFPGESVKTMSEAVPEGSISYYYGDSGKRDAVLTFLSGVCESSQARTLHLYSDEDMSWLYADPSFLRRWGALLVRFLKLGGRIKIIHTLRRDINELLVAVQQWGPLYATGLIEPCYCPRLRDGIFRRSLFVAPGHSALSSSSVTYQTSDMVNLLTHDAGAVAALEREFSNFLSLCRPLMRINGKASRQDCLESISDYLSDGREVYFAVHKGAGPEDEDDITRDLKALLDSSGRASSCSVMESGDIPADTLLTVKEDCGAMLLGYAVPCYIYRVEEKNISNALLEYIMRL